MQLRHCSLVISFVACILPAACQVKLTRYEGDGFSFAYPSNWTRQVSRSVVYVQTPELANQIGFKIFASGDTDLKTFFTNYRNYVAGGGLGFSASFESSTEPTLYRAWRGDTIHGRGRASGVDVIVSATAIEANGQIYLFQMIAPAARSWQASEYRVALANSLSFESLAVPSRDKPGPAGSDKCVLCDLLGDSKPEGTQPRKDLVGVWFKETADISTFERLTITLRPDGTYTKESLQRISIYGTGYIPAKHDGTWRASGTKVSLSGNGTYPGSTHDLAIFTKLR
jgi:hypothetical protein